MISSRSIIQKMIKQIILQITTNKILWQLAWLFHNIGKHISMVHSNKFKLAWMKPSIILQTNWNLPQKPNIQQIEPMLLNSTSAINTV